MSAFLIASRMSAFHIAYDDQHANVVSEVGGEFNAVDAHHDEVVPAARNRRVTGFARGGLRISVSQCATCTFLKSLSQ